MERFGITLMFLIIFVMYEDLHSAFELVQWKCGSDMEIMVQLAENITYCKPCPVCPRGRSPSIRCGSVLHQKEKKLPPRIKCRNCQKGTYSDSRSFGSCKPCTKCKSGERVIRNCTRWTDTICLAIACIKGFYFSQVTMSCLPCGRCCNDGNDVIIDECMAEGSRDHCSFQSSKLCQYRSNRNSTSKFNQSLLRFNQSEYVFMDINNYKSHRVSITLILSIFFGVTLLAIASLFIIRILRNNRMNSHLKMYINGNNGTDKSRAISEEDKRCNCFTIVRSQNVERFSHIYTSKDNQSDELDDFAKYDVASGLYIFKSSVYIRHDKTSTADGDRNLVVEILHDDPMNSNLDPDYVFISPIFKFYSQGTEFEKPVEICLPHSALIDSATKNWDIKVLCIDEREKHKAKWKEIDDINIDWNNIKYYTKTLLTYAVVGKPISSAKKRMQFALFSMQKMMSDRLEMTLYLLDESKYYLDRVIKENKTKGWEMLGCLYAVFVDFCNPVDILINIEELAEPWSLVHIKPDEVISSQLLRHSYFNIPMVNAVFRRSERRAKTFSCNFRVAIGGSEIIIPAVTFVPEEFLCVFVDVHNEDPSLSERQTLLSEVPYDIMYQMCRKLDIPARERGQWRDVGRHFGVSEVDLQSCCREYASLDGSPSRALMEIISCQRPKLAVGELIKFLDEHGRGDVVSVLSKVKD